MAATYGLNFRRILIMKITQLIGFTLLSTLAVTSCSENKSTTSTSGMDASQNQTSNKSSGEVKGAKFFVGALTETFNAGGYTYANVETSEGSIWAAGPVTPLKKGDKISFASKMLMKNFTSKAMKRDFKEIYFVKSFTVNGERIGKLPMASIVDTTKKNPHQNTNKQHTSIIIKPMKKADKGQDIAELIAKAKSFRGKTVIVRGQVTKVTANILGANWIHIRDSSTQQDLTITTSNTAKTGDIVLVKGKLALQKDFGKGFIINRVIADAKVKVE